MSENGEKTKTHGKIKRRWLGKAFAILAILGLIGLGAFCVLLYSFGTYDPEKLTNDPQSVLVYDMDGNLVLTAHGTENRVNTPVSEIPHDLVNAVLAAEDLRFYEHPGFDIVRIGGAIIADIRTGTLDQGASTITQQLIKNTHLTPEKSFLRKLKEAYLAYRVEQDFTKDEILSMYLNHVYLGNGAYGVGAAARAYFGKDVSELTLPECASIAAILKAPSNYAPHIKPENNKRRRDLILSTMVDEHMISQKEYEEATKSDVALSQTSVEAGQGHGWFTDAILEEARALLGIDYEELLESGYRIESTMNSALQMECEALFGDKELFPPNAADGTPAQAALVVTDVQTGAIRAMVGGREYQTRRGLNRVTQMRRQPGSALKPFAVYAPAIENYGYTAASILNDAPIDIEGYAPGNFGGTYRGPVTLRTALARSANIPAVLTLNDIGINAGAESARRFGITVTENDLYLPLALGSMSQGTTPLELCNAYAALGNGGSLNQPYLITTIYDSAGKELYRTQPATSRAISEQGAAVLTDLLKSAAAWGTASKIGATGLEAAAKTGTVSFEGGLSRDAWTAAYTPQTAVAVWMGFDITDIEHALSESVTGGGFPANLAAMALSLAQKESVPFPETSGVKWVALDKRALETEFQAVRATEITPDSEILYEIFISGSEPTTFSTYWALPRTPIDFSVARGVNGLPEIQFTVLDSFARYRLYRIEENGEQEEISAFKDDAEKQIVYTDVDAIRKQTYTYYIVPEHAEAVDLGKMNAVGRSTARHSYKVPILSIELPFDLESLLEPSATSSQSISPTPVPTPTPSPQTTAETTETPAVPLPSPSTTPEETSVVATTPKPTPSSTPKPSGPMFALR